MSTTALVAGRFVLYQEARVEIQHRCQTTRATDGFGFAQSWGTEVFLVGEFWKDD